MSHKITILIIAVAVAIVVAIGALYEWLVPGLSSARPEPGPVETEVATWLLHRSVPAEAKARTNPLANDPAELAAGHDLFSQKCEPCHGYDGGGKTEIGSGQYPRPPAPAIDGRVVDVGRRDFLSHQKRHQEYGHARLATAAPANLAARRLHSSSAARCSADCGAARHCGEYTAFRSPCRLGCLPKMPRGNLRALEQIADGERRTRSAEAS